MTFANITSMTRTEFVIGIGNIGCIKSMFNCLKIGVTKTRVLLCKGGDHGLGLTPGLLDGF